MVQKLHCYREQTKAETMLKKKKNPCEKGVKECGGDGVEAAAAAPNAAGDVLALQKALPWSPQAKPPRCWEHFHGAPGAC